MKYSEVKITFVNGVEKIYKLACVNELEYPVAFINAFTDLANNDFKYYAFTDMNGKSISIKVDDVLLIENYLIEN